MKFLFALKLSVLILFISWSGISSTLAQDANPLKDEGYVFTENFRLPATPVKNQYRSLTCWSYSTIAMLESELIRTGKREYDLSEAFIVRHTYGEKAKQYVRFQGKINFAGGGAFHDVLDVIRKHGIVPNNVYSGITTDDENFNHGEMDEVFRSYVDGVIKNKNKKLSPVWFKGFEGLLDAYLGEIPQNFKYKGKEYTSVSFAETLQLNLDDYVEIGSYTHHPFYKEFVIELPDNWALGAIHNIPLDEMMEIIDFALDHGFTVGWGADISEKGFSWTNGIAVVPDEDPVDLSGTERERWEKLSDKEKEKQLFSFSKPMPEKKVTQEMRQVAFDDYSTTDDHGMQIIGKAKDQNGNPYYIVKNSWGTDSKYQGFFYVSIPYVRLKTIDIIVNRKGIPEKTGKKLGL